MTLPPFCTGFPRCGCTDNGNPDAGQASGAGYIFLIADGISSGELLKEMKALRATLDSDFEALRIAPEGSA